MIACEAEEDVALEEAELRLASSKTGARVVSLTEPNESRLPITGPPGCVRFSG